jgi:hypothetical protein
MSEFPDDIMDVARTAAMEIAAVLPISSSDDVNVIARVIQAERNRCVKQTCFPAYWHTVEDDSTPALLEDICRRIKSGVA